MAMREETHFIIFKSDDRYSITECGSSGVKQAFMTKGIVTGDPNVLLRLSPIVPVNVSLRSFVDNNSGRLICIYDKPNIPASKSC
jgi:hypothetical protein